MMSATLPLKAEEAETPGTPIDLRDKQKSLEYVRNFSLVRIKCLLFIHILLV